MELGSVWAKRGGRKGEAGPFHPLACHLIDVGEIGRQMLEHVVSPAEMRWLADGFALDEASAARWIVIFSGLHDIGKSCHGFQKQIQGNSTDTPHGTVSTRILRKLFAEAPFNLEPRVAKRIAIIIGGHHGVIPTAGQVKEVEKKTGEAVWRCTWPQLIAQFLTIFPVPDAKPRALDNARAMWLAGFISAADWVGSNAAFFHYAASDGELPNDFNLPEYWRAVSAPAASKALHDLGWLAIPKTTAFRSFTELFPAITEPNNLQNQTVRVAAEMNEPGLVIIEAPMGEGKTEAALYLADQANVCWGMRGAYVALPTMATSNQMFERVRDFLSHRYTDDFVQVQLLHGHAALSEDVDALRENFEAYLSFTDEIEGIDGIGSEAALASAVAAGWFTGRKQGTLSPFGVGTIDQLLLSVLPIKHFFVRLFGLSNKTIILDEIHAYDSYMTTLLERLLGWLAAMNCHVVLLSATLPADKRTRLLAAYQTRGGELEPDQPGGPDDGLSRSYPRISWVGGGAPKSVNVTASDRGRKKLSIRWLELRSKDPTAELADELGRALANGGCAAVICNTVRRGQEIYAALQGSGHFTADELDLFHARFLFKHRRDREERCLERFGKPETDKSNDSKRPSRMVLIATQVIEQSLDLDFDLMVTELAPIDLLLQRAGRLHRHDRDHRPPGLETPQLWIIAPAIEDEMPAFDRGSEYVYFPHVLLRTWWELKDRSLIDVPDDVSTLIEAVYTNRDHPVDLPAGLRTRWAASADVMKQDEENDARIAAQWRISWPGTSGELGEIMRTVLEDEDADANPAVRAQTRLADPTVTVVCHRGPFRRATFEPSGPELNLAEPNRELVRVCLENSVSISQRNVVNDLLKDGPPKPWAKNSFLRSMRCIELDGTGGPAGRDWRLVINPELGVRIESTKGG